MIKIRTLEYINCDELAQHFGVHPYSFSFIYDCDCREYFVYLNCSDSYLQDLIYDLEDFADEVEYCNRVRNTVEAIKYLREELNITDGINVYVSW
jgi:hypothetical protein